MSNAPEQQHDSIVKASLAGRFRSRVDRLLRHPVTDIVVMVVILGSIVLLLLEYSGTLEGAALKAVVDAGDVVTVLFAIELSLRWYVAPSTRRHFQEYWLDWLGVLPALRPLRAFRVLRLLRALRLLRLYRFGAMAQRFVAGTEYHHFEESVRNEIAHYRGRFADQVWLVPELLRMFANLLEDGRVHAEARHRINAALAYFVTPFELFPRELHGPEGYIDQAYLCLWVVEGLQAILPDHVLEEAWEGEGEILEIVSEELPGLEGELGAEGLEQLGRYLGLRGLIRATG